jgi:hypothetical protein
MLQLNHKTKKLIPLAIGGLAIAGFQLYFTSGRFGLFEVVVLTITFIIIVGIILFIDKVFAKKE